MKYMGNFCWKNFGQRVVSVSKNGCLESRVGHSSGTAKMGCGKDALRHVQGSLWIRMLESAPRIVSWKDDSNQGCFTKTESGSFNWLREQQSQAD